MYCTFHKSQHIFGTSEVAMNIRIGAVNTDWTNRDSTINTAESLGSSLWSFFDAAGEQMHVMTLSEVSPMRVINSFHGNERDMDSVQDRRSNLIQLWGKEVYDIDGDYDASANYIGVPLRSRQYESRHLHISVHLPHKKGRDAAQANLKAYVAEKIASRDFAEVFVHGDFNIDYGKVAKLFDRHVVTIKKKDNSNC